MSGSQKYSTAPDLFPLPAAAKRASSNESAGALLPHDAQTSSVTQQGVLVPYSASTSDDARASKQDRKRRREEERAHKEERRRVRAARHEQREGRDVVKASQPSEASRSTALVPRSDDGHLYFYQDRRGDPDFLLYGVLPTKEVPPYDRLLDGRTLDGAENERWRQVRHASGKKEIVSYRTGGLRPDEMMRYLDVPRKALRGEGQRVPDLPLSLLQSSATAEHDDFIPIRIKEEEDTFHDHDSS